MEEVNGYLFEMLWKKSGKIIFERYLKYAKLHKKTWGMDKSRWDNHISGKDYLTKRGIVNILVSMRKADYSVVYVLYVLCF
ncbi:MAG: hypothetical protein ACI8ZB_002522 [Desulforhopalus sp.]